LFFSKKYYSLTPKFALCYLAKREKKELIVWVGYHIPDPNRFSPTKNFQSYLLSRVPLNTQSPNFWRKQTKKGNPFSNTKNLSLLSLGSNSNFLVFVVSNERYSHIISIVVLIINLSLFFFFFFFFFFWF
jgi:hypothetical protein